MTDELEAAEALAGLGRRSDFLEPPAMTHVQDPAIAVHQCSKYASNTVTCEETIETAVCQSKLVGKLKQSSNEDERAARKLRRVLANRESARQTIRRRLAMHLGLIKEVADLSEENENLNKRKELAVAKFNSLKDMNELLKTHMMRLKKPEQRDTPVAPKASHTEISTTSITNSPLYLSNQPSLVPCPWPSVRPSSDVLQFHWPFQPDCIGSSQFLLPHGGTHQGQDNYRGPIIVLPVPWMIPFLPMVGMFPTNDTQNEGSTTYHHSNICLSSDILPREESNQFSINQGTMPVGNVHGAKFTFPPDNVDQCPGNVSPPGILTHDFLQTTATQTSTVSTNDHMTWELSNKNQELHVSPKNQEDVFLATEVRRRRKELMKLKNRNCYHKQKH